MATLYILCGPSGSGKSTWASTYEGTITKRCSYISRDDIRLSIIKDEEDYFSHEKEVFRRFTSEIVKALKIGVDVIADATHLNEFSRRKLTQAIDMYTTDYKIIYVVFNVSAGTCIARNANRTGRANVPENVIRNMCRDFRAPTKDEDERVIDIIEVNK